MKDPNTRTKSFKQAFLKNLLLSLQLQAHTSTSFGNGAMSLHEKKRAVKSSVDVAMAAAHSGGARWPKAILAPASSGYKVQRCRRIVRRCCRRKKLVRSRTMALREVIPGGRDSTVDEATLLREAVDYTVHLRAQVDVLPQLSEAVQTSSSDDSGRAPGKEA
ncbi:hypothetical protein VPH35_132332 [Triticum aestivum]